MKKLLTFKLKSKKTLFLIVSFLLISFLAFTSSGQTFYKSLLVLSEQIPSNPIKPIGLLTKQPVKESLQIKDEERFLKVELLKPDSTKNYPLIIISPGAGLGFTQKSLEKLANSLARVGVGVAFPDIPEMVNLGVVSAKPNRAIKSLVNVFNYFQSKPGVDKQRMGFMGFCIGAGIGLVAAEDPRINSKVHFVDAFQPYYGISTLTLLNGVALRPDGSLEPFRAAEPSLNVIRELYIGTLPDQSDREILTSIFLTKKATTDNLTAYNQLTDKGKRVFDLLNNDKPEAVFKLFDKLPPEVKTNAQTSAPFFNIKNLKAKVFVFTDKIDSFLPHTESDFLIKNLPKNQSLQVETQSLNHLEPDEHFKFFRDLGEYSRIFNFIYQNLSFITQ